MDINVGCNRYPRMQINIQNLGIRPEVLPKRASVSILLEAAPHKDHCLHDALSVQGGCLASCMCHILGTDR